MMIDDAPHGIKRENILKIIKFKRHIVLSSCRDLQGPRL